MRACLKSRVILLTGEGKGKTTAALGMILRAAGHGMPAFLIQFIKCAKATGELKALARLPLVKTVQVGRGFAPRPDNPLFLKHRRAAENGLRLAQQALQSGRYRMLVLDEVCYAISLGLLKEAEVLRLVRQAGPGQCVILTGRDAGKRLFRAADTVTEMRCARHGLQRGIQAQAGVEY